MGFVLPFIAFLLILIFYLWSLYNSLVVLRVRIKEAWSQVDVQLKRRADLIPNLVETVRGYARHEKSVFENVTKARSALLQAKGPIEKATANSQLAGALKTLFAVAENYPKLAANENFLQLQKELSDTEDKVAYARQFYNTSVAEYNTRLAIFPNVLIAERFGFKKEEFFEVGGEERKKVKVRFD